MNSLRVYDPAPSGREPEQLVAFMQKVNCFICLPFRGGAEHGEAEGFETNFSLFTLHFSLFKRSYHFLSLGDSEDESVNFLNCGES